MASTHQWVVSWGKHGVASLLHLVTSFDPALYSSRSLESSSSRDLDPADDQRVLGWRAKRVGARFQPKNWEEQLHNKWELALRPPCHQSSRFSPDMFLFQTSSELMCAHGFVHWRQDGLRNPLIP